MPPDFPKRLRAFADVIVRLGVNIQAGQGLLLAEPFELQGVAPSAAPLVDAITAATQSAGGGEVDVIWADERRLAEAARGWPDPEFDRVLSAHALRMHQQLASGGALLFLQGSNPRLLEGVSPARVASLRERCWQHYGPVAARLVAGAVNWSVAPAPSAEWAQAVSTTAGWTGDADNALDRLWSILFAACRVDAADPMADWRGHLDRLQRWRADLDRRRARMVRYVGPGTDLVVELARGHRWCTAALVSYSGVPFVANLPTEEVFTAPDRASASGHVRVARPIAYGGAVINGIELEFQGGVVVGAQARVGNELLRRVLNTDAGSSRLGEVAMVLGRGGPLTRDGAWFHHTLLDENALPHIALGDGYPFSVDDSREPGLNHSLIHIDLPVDATVELGG